MKGILLLTTLPYFFGIGSAYQLAIGPLLYLYVRSLVDDSYEFKAMDLLHFIPFLIFQLNGSTEFSWTYFEYLASIAGTQATLFQSISWHLQPLVYVALLIHLVHSDHSISGEYFARNEAMLKWMRKVFYLYGAIWLCKTALDMFSPFPLYEEKLYYIPMSIVVTSFHIYIMVYLGLKRSSPSSAESSSPTVRYKGSPLSEEKSREYLALLLRDMEEEKAFKDPKLTLPRLAKRLSINSRYLSQIINESLEQNFYDFVNGYRIAEAKRELLDPEKDHYTIEAIAFEVGFNSKAAFYSTFKKQTRMTPSQFKDLSKKPAPRTPTSGPNGPLPYNRSSQ